jgi:hypothetical protein
VMQTILEFLKTGCTGHLPTEVEVPAPWTNPPPPPPQ